MDTRERKEREVTLQELLWKIIFGWRRLLICALVLGIIAGAVKYSGDNKAYEAAKSAANAPEVSEQLTEEEQLQIQETKAVQTALDESRKYMQDSVLMSVDPYAENVLVLQFYVDSDYQFNYTQDNSTDYTPDIVTAYGDYVTNGKIAQRVVEVLDLEYEAHYVQELISVELMSASEIFSVEVIYPEADVFSNIAQVIQEELAVQTEEISQSIGSHTLKLLSQNETVRTDSDLASSQKSARDMVINYRTQLQTLKAAMSETQLKVLETGYVETDGDEETVRVMPVKPSISMKYVLLGIIAGLLLGILWIVCKSFFTNRLQFADDLTNLYGLRSFGSYRTEKKRFVVDAFLWKLKTRKEKKLTQEEYFDIICANLELICKSANISRLYLCGTVMEQIGAKLPESIADKLKGAGIDVLCGNDVRYDMRSLRDMKEVGNAVLLEQVGVSGYQEIEKELKVLQEQQVEILGCICVE